VPAHTPDDERRAADPSTEPEVLEYLAKAFPDLRPVVAANPAIPAVLREQVLQMGLGNLSQVSPATPVSAATASDSTHLRTAKTAALPSITTTDYRSSPHTEAPVRATVQADPHTAVLKTLPTMPTRAAAPAPAQTAPVEPSEPRPASRSGSRTGATSACKNCNGTGYVTENRGAFGGDDGDSIGQVPHRADSDALVAHVRT